MNFDFIIIGGGTAGCVLARRLIDANIGSVALVESGSTGNHPFIKMPGGYAKLHKSKFDWSFHTTPQEHLDGRILYLPRGKVLGGSSATNAMAYVRGNATDYDEWAALGNEGWSYTDVLPLFKVSEHNQNIHDDYHGQNGPLKVSYAESFHTPYQDAFIEACQNHGLEYNQDYNGKNQAGVSNFQFTISKGVRQSTAQAFILPVSKHPLLKIFTECHVNKILIRNDEAYGVQMKQKNGSLVRLNASKHVFLCAGSFASPKILWQSGIGEPSELKSLGIEPIHTLSGVGKNLQDHLFYGVSASSNSLFGQNHHLKPLNQVKALWQYVTQRKGILTSSPLEATAFGNIGLTDRHPIDFQFHFASLHLGDNYEADFYDVSTFPTSDGFSILPTLLKPQSIGELGLSREGKLIINPNFLFADYDRQVLIRAGKLAYNIMMDSALDSHRQRMLLPYNDSEETIWEHIKKQVETVYHPVGTCKMGSDTDSVVDSRLRLHGIGKISVADASIMPTIVSGNTNAAVIMIAEKAAKDIIGNK
jgi:choline dehydrogenase